MQYFDISTIISPDTVTWDNESPPRIQWHRSISGGDYVNISSININTHSGTHVDAPYHFLEAGKKIHQLNLSIFMGEALVVEILEKTITASILESSGIPRTDRILLKTGSSRGTGREGLNIAFAVWVHRSHRDVDGTRLTSR